MPVPPGPKLLQLTKRSPVISSQPASWTMSSEDLQLHVALDDLAVALPGAHEACLIDLRIVQRAVSVVVDTSVHLCPAKEAQRPRCNRVLADERAQAVGDRRRR